MIRSRDMVLVLVHVHNWICLSSNLETYSRMQCRHFVAPKWPFAPKTAVTKETQVSSDCIRPCILRFVEKRQAFLFQALTIESLVYWVLVFKPIRLTIRFNSSLNCQTDREKTSVIGLLRTVASQDLKLSLTANVQATWHKFTCPLAYWMQR